MLNFLLWEGFKMKKVSSESVVKDIRRRTRKRYSSEGKIRIVQEALEQTELSPRELACRITDTKGYFISESSVYPILKSHDLGQDFEIFQAVLP